MSPKHKRIQEVYNRDVKSRGSYLYTQEDSYSVKMATRKQTDEILAMLVTLPTKADRLVDVGCGDGTYTIGIADRLRLSFIEGFDLAKEGINLAQKKAARYSKNTSFKTLSVYASSKRYKNKRIDTAVIRGVLHHLEDPARAIREICKYAPKVIVLEPNGYNPALKIIEKISPYHREHGEKSYLPTKIDAWFHLNGFAVRRRKFFSIVPYFCNEKVARALKYIEPLIEETPLLRVFVCGGYLVEYEKSR